MNGIELPEETSFHMLGLTFTRFMDWKPYIYIYIYIYYALPPTVKAATSVDVFKIRYDAAISELAKMT